MDTATIERARHGDPAAMERVLAAVAPSVHRFGMRMCRQADDADDVLQDTLLAITQNLPAFEGRSSLTSWVFTLARTACARRRRGLKNQPLVHADAAPEAVDPAPSPEDAALSHDLKQRVHAAIDELPESLREVIELRDVEGLPATEAAATLGITIEALKSRLHRARAALREGLRPLREGNAASRPTCPDVVDAISRKLEGDIDNADCAEMERHVAQCSACSDACDTIREALAVCRATDGQVAPVVQDRIKAVLGEWLRRR